MKLVYFFVVAFALCAGHFTYADNTVDDVFNVTAVDGSQATLKGLVKDLKVGDSLYFNQSPFQFKITAVNGNSVVIALPPQFKLTTDNSMVRTPSASIAKAIKDEQTLNAASGE